MAAIKKRQPPFRKAKSSKKVLRSRSSPKASDNGFPIVGIGASAGGLEAFILLLSKMPVDTGMSFVLVQHLDPTHPSMSVEIISKSTKLEIEEVKNGTRIEPNHVYFIPPNHNMEISNRVLKLSARNATPGQKMTIDYFLQSLARSEKSRAIGVVLSGTGTDGTKGLSAIRSEGGITFAENPKSAKYKNMPESAIAAGIVDFILPPEEIAKCLAQMAKFPELDPQRKMALTKYLPKDTQEQPHLNSALHTIFGLLRDHTKVDFSDYKQTTIKRRIERRMIIQKTSSFQDYAKYLQAHQEEVHALFNDILINVTDFFRDPDSFEILKSQVFPALVKNRPLGAAIRIWVPGCSTGEEVYSIAISLIEFLNETGTQYPIQIFATDISEKVINKARLGIYPKSISKHVTKKRLDSFFDKAVDDYKIHKRIRDVCLFSTHDVTSDPPFAKLDLISCRNVLIYFTPVLQNRVMPIFHYALNPEGFLWLGKSESPGFFSKFFHVVEKTQKVYAKSKTKNPVQFSYSSMLSRENLGASRKVYSIAQNDTDFQKEADRLILSKFAPPSVVINGNFEILQFRGRTVPFLEPANGQPSLNLLKMARPELLASLRSTIQSVKKENKPVRREGLHFDVDGQYIRVDIEALPVNPQIPLRDRTFLVLFKKAAASESLYVSKSMKAKKGGKKPVRDRKDKQIAELVQELAEIKDYQQSLIEQYEATQSEVTSANEELQSTNEEFLSANEEIETAREELQSTNEELVTVNEELQIRNSDLTTLSSDLNNLLASIEIPVLIVGGDHRVRRFSPNAKTAFNLIPSDIGRPIGDITSNFSLSLDALISEVTETLVAKELEVQDFNGFWLRVQCRPYRTVDNKIDGAIIALVDIDALKQKEGMITETLKEADKANLEKDVFLAMLSHELRTPLSAILTWSQLISQGKIDFEKAKQGALVIERNAKVQSQLIDDLLDISRIIAGKLALDIKVVNPGIIVRSAAEVVLPMAEKKAIRVEIDLNEGSEMIHADPARLQQIIWNLLTNAIKFSPKNSIIKLELRYIGNSSKRFVQIKVSDQGKGIPPDFLPHIFNRFSQTDSASTRLNGGLGLGLSIVQNLVKLQGGTVKAENLSEGTGAVFTVQFPLLSLHKSAIVPRVSGDDRQSGVSSDGKIENQPRLDGLRILLIDDDQSALEAIGIYLRSFGGEVMTVESAGEAIKSMPSFKPNVLVSDIAMPGEDGYSLIRKVRNLKLAQGGDVPALALTAYATADDTKRLLAAGFQAHMAKPVEANSLGRVILDISGKKINKD
jgi:two-component system CheB/CheR fusion protein